MEQFTTALIHQDGLLIVRAAGRVDHGNVATFIEEMRKAFDTNVKRVIVNMKDVGFLTSVGWGTLLSGASGASKRGARVVLCELNGPVKSSYELLSIQETLRSFPTEQDAIKG